MNKQIKIPTLLGLTVLLIGLTAGVFLVANNQIFKTQASVSPTPKNITVTNISSTSVSIFWESDQLTPGFVQAGSTSSLGQTYRDERDSSSPKPHLIHFVTLTNLSPDTTYYYKITSGSSTSPSDKPLTFKTTPALPNASYPPLIGTVLDTSSQPVEEALIVLDIPGAQIKTAITKVAGNFILTLADLKNTDLSQIFDLTNSAGKATLLISSGQKTSHITLALPIKETTLPPIILGQDLDISIPTPTPTPSLEKYDLNKDGVVNSLDLGTVVKNLGKNPKDKRTDLNQDGIVDQKDVDIINKMIPNNSPQR